jgi:hypothetical protein
MTGMLRVPRSRGALSGALLVLLGIWGGLIAFVGPYFHYAYTPATAWTYTTGRLWLEIVPAAGTIIGGLIVGGTASRPVAIFGAWLAALSGAWYVLGFTLSTLWTTGGGLAVGHPTGGTVTRAVEQIGFFTGLGLVIVFVAAVALGRFTVIGVRERPIVQEPPVLEDDLQPAGAHVKAPATEEIRVPETTVPNTEITQTRVAGAADTRDTTTA